MLEVRRADKRSIGCHLVAEVLVERFRHRLAVLTGREADVVPVPGLPDFVEHVLQALDLRDAGAAEEVVGNRVLGEAPLAEV